MYLKRAILVNWGNIPNIELDFGPVNLFSGGNGSGKTTAADAIQALMTAAHENLFAFNPGQDETTQKGRGGKQVRTLASYLLGCDDGSYARLDPTDGYIAGVFFPTDGEDAEPFTAVMAMRGHLEKAGAIKQARLDELLFLVLPGEQLSEAHFVRSDKGGRYVTPQDKIVGLLKKEFGSASVEQYDKKGAYLRRLYGALRGAKGSNASVSDREAKHAARTFAGFMAYKPVKSIHDFVAQEILEPKDLGEAIRSVSDLMKTIHEMEANAAQIKASAQILDTAKGFAGDYIQSWTDKAVQSYAAACQSFLRAQRVYLHNKQQQKECETRSQQLTEFIAQADDKRRQLHSAIVQLEAKRQGVQALRDKDALDQTIERCEKRLVESARPLLTELQQLQHNVEAATDYLHHLHSGSVGAELPALQTAELVAMAKTVSQNRDAAELDAHRILNQDWIDLSPLEDQLNSVVSWQSQQNRWVEALNEAAAEQPSLRDRLIALVERRSEQCQRLNQEIRKKQQEIQLLKDRQVSYPHYVDSAIKAIREQCPAAEPKVLCDYVDVVDARWQMAIEGYIGGARFSIVVEPEYEAQAISIVRGLRSERRNGARVIQGRKAERDAERLHPPSNSIIEVMAFSHSTAQAYLQASYGNVVRVDSAEALKNTARGVTAEGLGSGNYAMWRCDLNDDELVFGQTARQRALAAKEAQFEALGQQANQAEQAYQQARRLNEVVARLKPVELTRILQEMLQIQRDLQTAQNDLNNLDLSDSQSLETELLAQRENYEQQQSQAKQLEQELGGLQQQLKQCLQRNEQHADEVDKATQQQDDAQQNVEQLAALLPRLDVEGLLEQAEAEASNLEVDFAQRVHDAGDRLLSCERQLFEAVQQHNQMAVEVDQLVYDAGLAEPHGLRFFKHIVTLSGIIESLHNRLKNNILVERHRQLSQLKDSFNTAFVTNLCHSIYQAINEGKNILDDLNRELEHHRFGSDRERFYFDVSWVPEYQEYWQFFKAIINMPNLGDGATLFDAELPSKHARTRDRLLGMLLDDDEQTAHRELARISDYRNYRRYEIFKQPENKQPIALSQYGTGSGGQLETPAYIIRAAAVTSAFRFNEGKAHLRMVMVDEAFSKMDETRSREVIHYLTERLGLQLIFIMPTSKSGPFLDLISNQFVYTKCPTQQARGELKTRVLVDRKVCKQAQIAKLWANHRKTIRHQAMLDFMEDFVENHAN